MEKVVIRTVNISQDTRTFDYAPGYSFVRGGETDSYDWLVVFERFSSDRPFVCYNLWAQIIKVIEESKDQPVSGPVPFTLYGRKTLWRHHPYAAVADGLSHLCRYLKGGR